ncbi:unnamed protein product [Paramecium sonneborni]|uniref:Uncharacterized protein n=1 Tax=Paramecium sonneborni TaxID=65129 RepID=A0A8S1K5T2_9CILI|nr:unnamed protein product [Paramecium sonneborni]
MSKEVVIIEQNANQIKSSFQRWLVLLSYSIIAMANVMQLVSYSPIWEQAAIYYGIPSEDLQWIGNMYYITFFVLAPFCIKPLLVRLDISMHLIGILSAIGAWIIWIGGQSYQMTMIGLFIIGISDAMILIVPVFLSEKWFTIYERLLATSLGSFFQYIGMAFAYGFSSFYFDIMDEQSNINRKIDEMNLMIAIFNSIGAILLILFFRNRPPHPASNSDNIVKDTIMKSTIKMITMEQSIIDLMSLGIFIGFGWVYTTIISFELYHFGYTQTEVAINGTVYQISGVIVGLWASKKLDSQAKQGIQPDYDRYIKIFTSIGMIALILEAFILEYLQFWMLNFINFAMGVGLNSFYPIAIQSYIEKLYPAQELVLVTGLLCLANMVGFVLNYLIVLPEFSQFGLWIGCLTITPGYLYILLNYKTKYRRFEQEI